MSENCLSTTAQPPILACWWPSLACSLAWRLLRPSIFKSQMFGLGRFAPQAKSLTILHFQAKYIYPGRATRLAPAVQETGPPTPLLDTVNYPVHLKNLGLGDLKKLCKELRAGGRRVEAAQLLAPCACVQHARAAAPGRQPNLNSWKPTHRVRCPSLAPRPPSDLIHTVAKTGGHLGSSLGVVELSVALHYVFNTPEDKVIWDVGHQAYIHKMLTGRRSRMHTIRQLNGLSGEQAGRTVRGVCAGSHRAGRLGNPLQRAGGRRRRRRI